MIFCDRRSKIFGSRKKLVTLMSNPGEKIELACVAPQDFEVAIHVPDRRHRHPPLDPTLQRARLVEGEIVLGLGAKKIDDFGKPGLRHARRMRAVLGVREDRPLLVFDERRRNFGDRKHRSTAPVAIALRGMPS